MKATGIVRRIDDLGRIVIPKEIRRTLRVREGDPLEIFVDRDGEVILKKYSPISKLDDFAKEYAESLYESTGYVTLISDRDTIVSVGGEARREYLDKDIGYAVEQCLDKRKSTLQSENGEYEIVNGNKAIYSSFVIAPILLDGEPIGSVIMFSKGEDKLGVTELKLAETASSFLGKQMTLNY